MNAPLFSFILLLSLCFIDTKFLYLSSRTAKDEKSLERTDTGGSSTGVLTRVGEFLPFFFALGMCENLKISGKINSVRDLRFWRVDSFFQDKQKPTLLETFVLARVDDIDSR